MKKLYAILIIVILSLSGCAIDPASYYFSKNSYLDKNYAKKLIPMTLEACVVRISDIIAYIGRDLDDAIELNKIKK